MATNVAPKQQADATFTLFTKLPQELQDYILDIACETQQSEPRILRIAEDAHSAQFTEEEAMTVELRIVCSSAITIPSLLHTCRYTRNLSLRTYELWSMANKTTHETTDAKIYVNKQNDVFYFEGQTDYYWFLRTILFGDEGYDQMAAYGEARCRFLEQTFGIKMYGFHWDLLKDIMTDCHHSWIASLQPEHVVVVIHEERMYEVLENPWIYQPHLVEEHLEAPASIASPYCRLQEFQEEMKDLEEECSCKPPTMSLIWVEYGSARDASGRYPEKLFSIPIEAVTSSSEESVVEAA